MNDYDAIRHLMAEYCFATDAGDTDRWLACFTDDIRWEGGAFGRFEGKAAARDYHRAAGDATKNYRHINTNVLIDLSGDSARVNSYILVLDQSAGVPAIAFSGFYRDEIVRQEGAWRIRSRALLQGADAAVTGHDVLVEAE